jgi:hypothetical protein
VLNQQPSIIASRSRTFNVRSANAGAKRRADGVLAKHDDASRRVRLSALLGALFALPPVQDCVERR